MKYKLDGTIDRYKVGWLLKDMHILMKLTVKRPLLL